jgi:molecular chaperone IbpA
MVNINWEHYTPYSIGFDETFSRLEAFAGGGSNYPPYNVVNGSDGRTLLEVALAGFTSEEIEVTTERHVLSVNANKTGEDKRSYTHKGISKRSFNRNWEIAKDVEVESVEFKDGLLTIILVKELPEKQKRKKWF